MGFQIGQATEVLSQTPAVMDALLRGKSAQWLHCRKTPEAFSPLDVLGHLIHAERTDWIPRARIVLESGSRRAFEPFDRFGFAPLIAGQPPEKLLDEFAQLRRASLQALRDLGIEEQHLGLAGLHPEFGAVTLGNLLATWAVHDLAHIAQVAKTMASEFRDAVGPWRAYTSILD